MSTSPPQLARVLGKTHLVALGIGAIIGAGIFVVPGPAAAQFAGPALTLSLVGASFGCALAGLCYAELASLFPLAGGAYSYAVRTLGRLTGWIIGWLLLLEYLFAAAILAVGWSGYFTSLLATIGWHLPAAFIHSPLSTDAAGTVSIGAGFVDLPAAAIVLLAGLIAMRNVKLSATVNAAITFTKIGIILLVIVAAIPFVVPSNWHPFLPPNTGRWGEFGISGVIRGAAVTFYIFLGFDTVSVAAQEARNPQRDVPSGIIGSLLVCTVLFIPFVLVLTGLTNYRNLNVAQPTVVALAAAGPHLVWLQLVVEVGAMIGMFSVLLVVLMAEARVLYAMAQDGLVPPVFGVIHPRSRTPVTGTLIATVLASGIGAVLPISLLTQMVSVGALVAFISVAASVLVLRRTQPKAVRPFRTPGVPLVPVGAIVICGCLILALPPATWVRFGIWLGVGLLVYGMYGRKG